MTAVPSPFTRTAAPTTKPDTPSEARFRAFVRHRLALCDQFAAEQVGPAELAWHGYGNGRNINGAMSRIRREEMEAAGFRKNAGGYYERTCAFPVARRKWDAPPRGDLIPCGRFIGDHPVKNVGLFVNHENFIRGQGGLPTRPHHDPTDHDCKGGVKGDLAPF